MSVLLGSFSGFFGPLSFVSLVAPFLFERFVGSDFSKAIEFQSRNGSDSLDEWGKGVDVGSGADFLGLFGGVVEDSVFGFGDGFLLIAGEKDEFVDVVLQSVFIDFERLLASVFASVVDGDSDGSCELHSQTGGFDFCESES